MEAIELTPEQIAERERLAMISQEGQTREFRDAIKQALNTVNLEIAANGGQPAVDAVMAALTSIQAEFIAMAPHRYARRMQIKEIERELPRLVALRTGCEH
ncbi:hypothetical protein LB572_03080 [Mesorhizobium sp. BH1-1-5]|uniref:hypothetical protein n=1 Tax=Mesorhizobium sp. BH1-1-5 TaxID=2876661 RepID=UPI001CCAA3BB|nr:hypothetical protein [Mesorhizobium sp. BH1-1-5]MBZ9986076.1 hypothetical protein [Mesorhizobium sp. BH1-1-5]